MAKENSLAVGITLSNICEYDDAIKEFIFKVSDKLMIEINPVLSLCTFETKESIGKMQTQVNDEWIETKNREHSFSFIISNTAIECTNIEDYICIVYDIAKQKAEHIIPQMFNLIKDVCDRSGQTVDAGGEVFSYDLFLDALEKIDITFDENDEPIKPTLILNPGLYEIIKDITPTPEQETREKLIWERKKADFLAKKRSRRLL